MARHIERGFALVERVERELPTVAGFFPAESAMHVALSDMIEGARKVEALLRAMSTRPIDTTARDA